MTLALHQEAKPSRFRPLTIEELARLPKPSWDVDGLFVTGGLSMLFSEPGGGKTLLALDLALSMAAGIDEWFGRRLRGGLVVYAAGEGLRSLSPRIEAWRSRAPGVSLRRFLAVPDVPGLGNPAECAEFITELANVGATSPALLVIDTLARATAGRDENDALEMGISVDGLDYLARELACGILVLHHSGWSKGRERGSSALRAACDTVAGLERDGDDFVLRVVKQRDGEIGTAMRLRLSKAPPSVVFDIVEVDEAATGPDLTPRQLDVVRSLIELNRPATFTDLVGRTGASKSTVFAAVNLLIRYDLIRKSNDRYELTEQGRDAVR